MLQAQYQTLNGAIVAHLPERHLQAADLRTCRLGESSRPRNCEGVRKKQKIKMHKYASGTGDLVGFAVKCLERASHYFQSAPRRPSCRGSGNPNCATASAAISALSRIQKLRNNCMHPVSATHNTYNT